MKLPLTRRQFAQAVVVLACAFALKLHYTTAAADDLRWMLAPTTTLVEAVTGIDFVFESHAGYLSRERGFLIAASCAGINFLLAAFLLLTLGRLWRGQMMWRFIPAAAAIAYLVTLAANALRICVALWLVRLPAHQYGWQPAQLHRAEGILVYFGFLLLLFTASEWLWAERLVGRWQWLGFPLLIYYATALGVPLVTRVWRQEELSVEHALTVLLLPLLPALALAVFYFLIKMRQSEVRADA